VAARISALAEADQILVSAAVVEAVGRHVTIARRGSTELKGIGTGVACSDGSVHTLLPVATSGAEGAVARLGDARRRGPDN